VGRHEVISRWQSHEDAILREKYATTLIPELCVILGRSYRSVCGRLHRLGLRKNQEWSRPDLQWLLNNREKTHSEIAAVLGRTCKSIGHVVIRFGLQKHTKGLSEEQRSKFLRLHSRGYSDLLIARKLKVTKSRVMRYRIRVGLDGNGYTDKSSSATSESLKRYYQRIAKVLKVRNYKDRNVEQSELIDVAFEVIGENDELLSVAWEGINEAWQQGVTRKSGLVIAGKQAVKRFHRETTSYLSMDNFVNSEGERFELSEDVKENRMRHCA